MYCKSTALLHLLPQCQGSQPRSRENPYSRGQEAIEKEHLDIGQYYGVMNS